jgi:deazaflavin-dependent oxidoreductase (nitroreductase family)
MERTMSLSQRLGAVVVALFALAFTRAPALIRLMNPVMRRLLSSPLPAGPNVLLQVRGRKSGRLRSFPVAFLAVGDRGLLQAAARDEAWVHNLRAAGEAVVVRRGRAATFEATELDPKTGGLRLHDLLAPFPRSRLVGAVVGPVARPPVAVLQYFRLRVDDSPDQYVAVVRQQPLFELRQRAPERAAAGGPAQQPASPAS